MTVKDITKLAGGGEYPGQDGFGWTNGVLLKLISWWSAERVARLAAACVWRIFNQ
jgi:neutral trehalase